MNEQGHDADTPPDYYPETAGGYWGEDALEEARRTVMLVMAGRGGRGAQTRLAAARTVLAKDFLTHFSDEALLAELKRRAGMRHDS